MTSDTKKILTDFQGVQEFAFLTKFRLKWHLENAVGNRNLSPVKLTLAEKENF